MLTRSLKLAGAALIAAVTIAPDIAQAQYYGGRPPGYYERGYAGRDYGRGGYDGYERGGYDGRSRGYVEHRRYEGRRGYYRNHGRCDRGTGGTILGAIAGGLLGDSVAGRGDRTAGALVGAGVGALAGRAIDRDC